MSIVLLDISIPILLWKEGLLYWYKESWYMFTGARGRDFASITF